MKYFIKLNKLISLLYFLYAYKSYRLAKLFNRSHLSIQDTCRVKRNGDHFEFTRTGNKMLVKDILKYKRHLKSLVAVLNDERFKVVADGSRNEYLLNVDGVTISLHSVTNVFVAYEIFIQKLYDISIPHYDNVIMDIGMNVGYATLFFASMENVAQVYAYEPFLETFKEATNNIELNPHLKSKISMFKYGISSKSKIVEVPAFESGSAVASTSKFFLASRKKSVDKTIKVEVKDIIEALDEVAHLHPEQNIILKIDCEGEEYDIMDKLNNSGLMDKVFGFLIEWHIKGPKPIIEILNNNGFVALHLPRVEGNSGMIYSFRC